MANRTAKSSQSSHLEQAKIEYLEPFADEVLRCKRLLGEAQYNLDKAYYLAQHYPHHLVKSKDD